MCKCKVTGKKSVSVLKQVPENKQTGVCTRLISDKVVPSSSSALLPLSCSQDTGKTWAGLMQQEGEQLAKQKLLNCDNDIPVTHRTCQITSTIGLKSLLSCPRWISDRITWPFKCVICVRALCKGSSQQEIPHLSYMRLQMQSQQSCSADAVWNLVWGSYSPNRSRPCTGRDSGAAQGRSAADRPGKIRAVNT